MYISKHRFPRFPSYSLPFCHVPQMLAKRKAYNAEQLWLVTYTIQSTTLIEVDFDPILWDKIMSLAEKKYSIAKPVVLTRLHEESKSIRPEMMKFIKTHSRLVCKVPSLRGEMEINLPEFYISPYSTTSMFLNNKHDFLHMFAMSCLIADEAELLLQKIHDVLRLQATELLVFMISDNDRLQDSSTPNSMPLAYALKGRCLSNSELRYLINKVRNKLHERKIKVPCEIYDGQWQYTVMHDEAGNPLNRLRVCTSTWSRINKLSKSRIVDELLMITSQKFRDYDLLRFNMFTKGTNTYINIEVTKTSAGALHITTLGGNLMKRPCAKYVITPLEQKFWKEELLRPVTCTKNVRKAVPKSYGLKPTERNILSVLLSNCQPILGVIKKHCEDTDDDEEYLPDLMPIQSGLGQMLTSQSFKLLEDIALELKEYAPDKWQHLTVSDLFPEMLHDSKVLVAKCTKDEIRIIGNVLESYTSRAFFNGTFTKARNANIITRAFEGNNFVEEVCKPRPMHMKKYPDSLKNQCLKLILDRSYPLLPLQVPYTNVTNWVRMTDWAMKSKIHMSVKIPRKIAGLPDIQFQFFCYPELNAQRKQLEPRTLDFSHVLTSVRMRICRHDYDFCKTTFL